MGEIDDLREEVAMWRRDAAARLWRDMAMVRHFEKAGERDRAVDLKVNSIDPTLHSLRDADAKDWHLTCEGCGKALLNGHAYFPFDDANGLHVNCNAPSDAALEPGALIWDDGFSPEQMAKIIADAKAMADE